MDKVYKGFDIQFEEDKDCFVAYKDGERFGKHQSLQQLKLLLNKATKKSFQRLPIYFNSSEFEIEEGAITSFNSLEKEVWVIYGKGKAREKINLSWDSEKLVLKTPANLTILQESSKVAHQIERLEKQKEKLNEKLDTYNYEKICKITGENPIED